VTPNVDKLVVAEPVRLQALAGSREVSPLLPLLSALLRSADGGHKADFGPNVLIFNPSLPSATMQEQIDKVWTEQGNSQFGAGRYALLFLPGAYKWMSHRILHAGPPVWERRRTTFRSPAT